MSEPIKVAGRTLKTGLFSKVDVEIDIRRFVNPRMIRVPAGLEIPNGAGMYQGGMLFPTGEFEHVSFDAVAHIIQKWAVGNLVYGPDTFWGSNEFFLLPEESLAASRARCGIDCEDGANLMLSLMLSAGIPRERCWCSAGYVNNSGERIGHGYVVYVNNAGIPVVCDWCFMEDSHKEPCNKPAFSQNDLYEDPWFSWNDQSCWVDQFPKMSGKFKNVKPEGQGD